MGISTTTNRVSYVGDGSSATFAFQYEFHAQADLDVYIWNSSRTVATVNQVLSTNYTISGVQDAQNRYTNGGNVIFNSTPSATDYIIIVREAANTNPFNLKFNQVIPNAELVKALDRLTIIEQRLTDLTTRSVKLADSYPLSFTATLPDRLPAGAPIIVGSSGVTMEVGVVALTGTTAATYFGILPVNNGGTGLDHSLLTGLIYSPGNNTTFNTIPGATPNYVLTSNGSSAPTFQAIATTLINSGILVVDYGGTGTGTSYIQYGVVFASSATQMASTPVGGLDLPLVGNTGAAPSFRALNISSGSTVTGIMAQSKGGTGSASSWPLYGVIYQDSASALGFIPSAADGRALVCHGSSAPSFDAITVSPVIPTALTANTTLDITYQTVILNSSGYTVTLYDAVARGGRKLKFVRNDSNISNVISIVGSGAQTIGGYGNSYGLYTTGEILELESDNSNWLISNHYAKTDTVVAGSSVLVSISGVKGSTIVDGVMWNRDGMYANIIFDYQAGSAGTNASDFIKLTLPTGMLIDTQRTFFQSSVTASTSTSPGALEGSVTTNLGGSSWGDGTPVVFNSTLVRFGMELGGASVGSWGASMNNLGNANVTLSSKFRVPIKNWKP